MSPDCSLQNASHRQPYPAPELLSGTTVPCGNLSTDLRRMIQILFRFSDPCGYSYSVCQAKYPHHRHLPPSPLLFRPDRPSPAPRLLRAAFQAGNSSALPHSDGSLPLLLLALQADSSSSPAMFYFFWKDPAISARYCIMFTRSRHPDTERTGCCTVASPVMRTWSHLSADPLFPTLSSRLTVPG